MVLWFFLFVLFLFFCFFNTDHIVSVPSALYIISDSNLRRLIRRLNKHGALRPHTA